MVNLVNFRNKSDKKFIVSNWWTNGRDQMAFSRGNLGFVLINNSNQEIYQSFQTGLKSGYYCNLIDTECSDKTFVNPNGYAIVHLNKMSAFVIQ